MGRMTERLYYLDSYLKEFSGAILEQRRIDENPAVILDRTAFYPASGGQLPDRGMLGEARVVDVLEDEAGSILHFLDREIPPGPISGRIDWDLRFDHMQQHTGQHILSQAFIHVARAPTLSFHMGKETSTIDIELAQPTPSLIEEVQAHATGVVFEDRVVLILNVDRDRLGSLGLRKESQRQGEIRVIDIEGCDRSACGGTHVRRTGEIGIIFILGFERYKGGTRVEFVAGTRALVQFQKDHEMLKKLGRFFSANPENLPGLVEKLLLERSETSREMNRLQNQLQQLEAEDLYRAAVGTKGGAIVRRIFAGRSLDSVKALAQKLTARPGVLALLGNADTCQIIVARSKDVRGDCNLAIKEVAANFGGRGGGRPELAQAGGFPAESMDFWLTALEKYFADPA
jgi:alanyl-tRNA synthetase